MPYNALTEDGLVATGVLEMGVLPTCIADGTVILGDEVICCACADSEEGATVGGDAVKPPRRASRLLLTYKKSF